MKADSRVIGATYFVVGLLVGSPFVAIPALTSRPYRLALLLCRILFGCSYILSLLGLFVILGGHRALSYLAYLGTIRKYDSISWKHALFIITFTLVSFTGFFAFDVIVKRLHLLLR